MLLLAHCTVVEVQFLVQAPSEGGSGSSSAAPRPQQAAAPGGVINLGVVGRGSKRINLQPVSAAAAPSTGALLAQPQSRHPKLPRCP